jgi:metallo-beta-lactamase family protein
MRGWHVIVASSGMCDAGRVRHHLKRLLWRDDATVLLTGYQAIGTLGRLLQEGRKAVRIQGEEIKVSARVRSIDVYSGHADANNLVGWIKARRPSGAIFLVHGEPENREGLKRRLEEAGFDGARIVAPELDAAYLLAGASAPSKEIAPAARVDAKAVARLDWHNQRSEFLARLNESLDAAGSDANREALLTKLQSELPPPLAPDQGAAGSAMKA